MSRHNETRFTVLECWGQRDVPDHWTLYEGDEWECTRHSDHQTLQSMFETLFREVVRAKLTDSDSTRQVLLFSELAAAAADVMSPTLEGYWGECAPHRWEGDV